MTATPWYKHPVFFVSVISLLSVAIFFDTWRSIVDIWIRSETFAHGFVIAPISFWLIWTRRAALSNLKPEPTWLPLVVLMLNGMIWLMADQIDVLVIKQFAVVGVLISSVWCYLGYRIVSKIAFPLLFLYLMVPFGEWLFPYLMDFTANFTVKLLRLTGISVYQEGLFFTLTTGSWSVIEACSGLRYLIASATLGLVYAYISYNHFYKRFIFSIVAIIVPIIANGFRAYMIVMIGHLSNMQLAVGIDHVIYGAIFFGIVMLILFFIGSFWRDAPITVEYINNQIFTEDDQGRNSNTMAILAIISACLAVWPVGSHWLKSRYDVVTALMPLATIQLPASWHSTEITNWPWKPTPNGVVNENMNFFDNGKDIVAAYQASFGKEVQGSELINSNNNINRLIFKSDWRLAYTKSRKIKKTNGELLTVDESLIKGIKSLNNEYVLIFSWYQIGNKQTSNPFIAKCRQLFKRLTLDSSPEMLILLMVKSSSSDQEGLRSSLMQFMSEISL